MINVHGSYSVCVGSNLKKDKYREVVLFVSKGFFLERTYKMNAFDVNYTNYFWYYFSYFSPILSLKLIRIWMFPFLGDRNKLFLHLNDIKAGKT